jgi:hypothetical protein
MPSTVIASMIYNVETSTLRVTFVSGMIFKYKNVPKDEYIAIKTSAAKGIYLNQPIKGKYPFKKIR